MVVQHIPPEKIDNLARIIAKVLYHPAPEMSGDIWKVLGEGIRKRCIRAAEDIINEWQSPDA